MIKEGKKSKAKYWGKFEVEKVVKLNKPVACRCEELGTAFFNPTIVKLKWETPPSDDVNKFWFPYWMTINGKEKYGQFAPMIGEKALSELLVKAMQENFFSRSFLLGLKAALDEFLS